MIILKYGYARVSTQAQDLSNQVETLEAQNCSTIYKEKFTGTTTNRHVFDKLLDKVQAGDEIVVVKLDRFARNAQEALNTMSYLKDKGVKLTSLDIGTIDSTPMGNLIFQVFSAFAQFERDLIVSRTQAGKAYARKHDKNFHEGHPFKYSNEQILLAYDLWIQGNTHRIIEAKTGVCIATQKKRFRELKACGIIKEDEQKRAK